MDNARPHPLTLLRPTDCTFDIFTAALRHLTGDNAGWNPGKLQGFVYDADGFDPYCVVPSGCQSRWWVERADAGFAEAHDTLGEALGAIEAHRAGDLDDDPLTSKPREWTLTVRRRVVEVAQVTFNGTLADATAEVEQRLEDGDGLDWEHAEVDDDGIIEVATVLDDGVTTHIVEYKPRD